MKNKKQFYNIYQTSLDRYLCWANSLVKKLFRLCQHLKRKVLKAPEFASRHMFKFTFLIVLIVFLIFIMT